MTSLRVLTILLLLWTGGLLWASDAAKTNGGSIASPGRVVILGDSVTAGYGLDDPAQQAYPALLQRKIDAAGLPFTVVNAGVSGDTTASGLRRVDWVLGPGAAVLVVALGGNDGLRGIPPRQTAENLAAIIRRARAKVPGLAVIVAGMEMPESMGHEFAEQFKAVFSRVAMENDATLIPFLLEGVGGVAALNQPDRIHPTAEGQKRVAANVWAVLQQVLEARHATTGDGPLQPPCERLHTSDLMTPRPGGRSPWTLPSQSLMWTWMALPLSLATSIGLEGVWEARAVSVISLNLPHTL